MHRCANLLHLCTYVLSDKTRETYNFDHFLVPVASSFGEHDGRKKIGMLQRQELEALRRTVTGTVGGGVEAANDVIENSWLAPAGRAVNAGQG